MTDTNKEHIKDWWAESPMTYGEIHGEDAFTLPDGTVEYVTKGSKRFFELADQRFYSWNKPLHINDIPFSKIFDYEKYKANDVLEVGCGLGCMAMNWAKRGARITAVDLNPTSIRVSKQRFELMNLSGNIFEADANELPLLDESFDYVYSWGVLHHSPNLEVSLAELYRVLRPGGQIGIMLYNRESFLYQYQIQFLEGFLNMENHFLNELELASRYTDGAKQEGNPHTWPITPSEAHSTYFSAFDQVDVEILGTDLTSTFDHWMSQKWRKRIPTPLMKALARRWGWSLWITGAKAA